MKFKIENEAMSRMVQEKLFELGYKFAVGIKDEWSTNKPFIIIDGMRADFFYTKNIVGSSLNDVYAFLGEDDGWIENCGEMICQSDTLVDLKYFNGEMLECVAAIHYEWYLPEGEVNRNGYIIEKWRPHKEKNRENMLSRPKEECKTISSVHMTLEKKTFDLKEIIQKLIDNHEKGLEDGCSCHNRPPCNSCVDYGYGLDLAEYIALEIERLTNPNYDEAEKEIRDLKEQIAGLEYENKRLEHTGIVLAGKLVDLEDKGDVLGRANKSVMDRFKL